MNNYKEVFELAQGKGYDSIIIFPARYSGSAKLPHEVIESAGLLCELTLIQKFIRDQHNINIYVDIHGRSLLKYWYAQATTIILNRVLFTTEHYATYEAAMLNGIHEALKLIP